MNNIIRYIIALIISYGLLDSIRDLLNYKYTSFDILLISFFTLLTISVALFNKKTRKFSGLVILITASILAIILYAYSLFIAFFNLVQNYFIMIFDSMLGNSYADKSSFLTTLVLISFLLSFVIYFFIMKKRHYLSLSIIIFVYFLILFVTGQDLKQSNFILFVLAMFFLYFENFYNRAYSSNSTKISVPMSLMLVFSIILFSFIVTTSSSFFSSKEPDAMGFIEPLISKIQTFSIGRKTSSNDNETVNYETEVAYSYNDSSYESTTVMIVNSDENFHLRSQTYQTYENTFWTNESLPPSRIPITLDSNLLGLELIQNILGLYQLENPTENIITLSEDNFFNYANEAFHNYEATITYKNIETTSIFAPTNVYKITSDEEEVPSMYMQRNGTIHAYETLPEGFSFTVNTFTPKHETSNFKKLLRKTYIGYYDDYGVHSVIKDYNQFVYNNYLDVPKSIPQRVSKLASDITSEYQNNYDKVRAIENYLSTNYDYDITPEPTKEDEDFIDYFLFEGKEGYCTYYAAAMTIMTRSIGIPARYTRGYVLPKQDINEMEEMINGYFDPDFDPNKYIVREQNAHAWTEVYFEGYGWLIFEPTAPYYDDYNDDIGITPISDIDTNEDTQIDSKPLISIELLKTLLLILSIIVLLTLISLPFIIRKRKENIYRKYSNRRKIIYNYHRLLKLLKIVSIEPRTGETLIDFSLRVDKKYYLSHTPLKAVANIINKAMYSEIELTVFDLNIIESFYFDAKKEILSYANKFKIISYFILNRI